MKVGKLKNQRLHHRFVTPNLMDSTPTYLGYGNLSPYDPQKREKLGNTLVYLCNHVLNPTKTKLLKLLYILDEVSLKRTGIPFLDLEYKVWKYGPVEKELFVDLQDPMIFSDFLRRVTDSITLKKVLEAKVEFNDDEFTDSDIEILEEIATKFKNKTAKELSDITHKPSGPWYKVAKKNGLLELLEKEKLNTTEHTIDLSEIVKHDEDLQQVYYAYKEFH